MELPSFSQASTCSSIAPPFLVLSRAISDLSGPVPSRRYSSIRESPICYCQSFVNPSRGSSYFVSRNKTLIQISASTSVSAGSGSASWLATGLFGYWWLRDQRQPLGATKYSTSDSGAAGDSFGFPSAQTTSFAG